jgi:glycerophosphoryl diester phosphodiesterase
MVKAKFGALALTVLMGLDDKTEENQKAVDLGVDIIATDHPEKFIMKYGKPSI